MGVERAEAKGAGTTDGTNVQKGLWWLCKGIDEDEDEDDEEAGERGNGTGSERRATRHRQGESGRQRDQ